MDKESLYWDGPYIGGNLIYSSFEDFDEPDFDTIFCAHAFEHMQDSPGMMAKAFSQLKPGGRLVLIVPNDEDKCNPDHLWFWRSEDLHRVLSRIGFTDIKTVEKRRVPHEMFIYASAVKP